MTTSRRRIVVDRRRRRANARPTRRQPAAVDAGKEFAEAVFGHPPTGSRSSRSRIAVGVARERPALRDVRAS